MGLVELKRRYGELQKKYGLPSFKEMNEDFYIEKISETDTEILIREVKRHVGDRLANYLRFLESFLNPGNAPMFVYSIVKTVNAEDKKKISEAYKNLVKNEIRFIALDIEFNESEEAKFIKESFELWQDMKKSLSGLFGRLEKSWDSAGQANGENKGYFG